jgi:hypothetical protein
MRDQALDEPAPAADGRRRRIGKAIDEKFS